MNPAQANSNPIYRLPWPTWCLIFAGVGAAAFAFRACLGKLLDAWSGGEEYSHAVLVPFIVAFLIWQRKDELERAGFEGSWSGFALVCFGVALQVVGRLATLFVVQQYALLIVVYGLVLAVIGWRMARRLAMPLLLLLSMVPLPQFLMRDLSAELQLISSLIGVGVIRLFGISVLLQGNIIDLGDYKLEVAAACSGLRYLFPLAIIGLIIAYFFQAAMWKRIFIFLSSIAVTILMNSLRIGIIGVMVDLWGGRMAEGFLHDFEGWAVFMASIGVLLLETRLLTVMGGDRRPWRQVFNLDSPPRQAPSSGHRASPVSVPLMASTSLLALFTAAMTLLPERSPQVPARTPFTLFPTEIGSWSGRQRPLEPVYLSALKLDDYVVADYVRADSSIPVNFYVAWYNSQTTGESVHSPRSCIPGGGWLIVDLSQRELSGVELNGAALRVNRVLIQNGTQKELVYYWFQQRGRDITNEYLLKWYLLQDSIMRNRADGALVRLVAPIRADGSEDATDRELTGFLGAAAPSLNAFIPN